MAMASLKPEGLPPSTIWSRSVLQTLIAFTLYMPVGLLDYTIYCVQRLHFWPSMIQRKAHLGFILWEA